MRDSPSSPRPDGLPQLAPSMIAPDCGTDNLAKLTSHRIMVIVADRAFDDPTNPDTGEIDLGRVKDDGKKVVASWTLDMECK